MKEDVECALLMVHAAARLTPSRLASVITALRIECAE